MWNENYPNYGAGSENSDDNNDDLTLLVIDNPQKNGVIWQSLIQCRFVILQNRTKRTLNAAINRYVQGGIGAITDMCCGYNELSAIGYVYNTVSPNEEFRLSEVRTHIRRK